MRTAPIWDTSARRRAAAWLAAAIALALAALVAAGGAPSADARAKAKPGAASRAKPNAGALAYLRAPGCPVAYRSEKEGSYERKQERRALHWQLKVHHALLDMRPPINWQQNPYQSRAFEARLADLSFLDQLLYIYVSSKDFGHPKKRRALRMALQIVLDWTRAERQGEVNGETWTDRPAARRATFVAFVSRASACEGMLDEGGAKLLLGSIREHARWLRDPAHYKPTNHGLSIDLSLAALGRYLPQDRKIARGARRGERRYKRTFYREFNEAEGVWLEHSMGYYDYAINLVDDYLRTVDPTDPGLRSARQGLVTSLAWLTMPNDRMAMFGDTDYDRPQEEVQERARTQSGLWVAPTSGYAVVKDPSAGSWLAIASSYHSGVHKQSDELTFELWEDDARIIQDTGQYHKDRDRYYEFQRSPAAHCTLVVDGKQFDTETTPPYGSGILAWGEGDGWYAIWAQNPVLQSKYGVAHSRLFLYKPGYALIVADRVLSDREHSYKRYFQLGTKVKAVPEGADLLLRSTEGFKGRLSSFSTAGPGTLETVEGQEDPLAGWYFPHFRDERPRTTASWRTVGQSVDHLATFSLDGPDLRAGLASPLGDDTTITLQDEDGLALGAVHVVRSGNAISVDATP